MKVHPYLLVFGFLFATPINAQVYKCTFVDAVTRQDKVIYTDAPCTKSSKQTLTSIQAKSNLSAQAVQTSQQAQVTNLDSAVTIAVLNRDFKLAKSLANTKEHWRLIAIAEGEAPPQAIVVANTQPVVSHADECTRAKNNFEYVSRNSWRDRDLVAAKKSIMYAACGVSAPASNSPVFVGQRFGGFQSGHLFYPYAAAPYYAPYQSMPNHIKHNYPHANGHYYGQNHLQSGYSLNYRTRNFGISTGGVRSGGIRTGGFNKR